jgi:pyruvate dehydrogenase E2 component (dihydrolipoamide acetyltransferase)
MAEFLMPKLGADMTEGKLVAWHKKPGDRVNRGDIVAEVDTDKGVIDIEIFTSGVIQELAVQPGQTVPIGAVLAIVQEEGAAPGVAPAKSAATAPTPAATPKPAQAAAGREAPVVAAASRPAISPAARRLARELGVDPATIQGTGRGGAITLEDIQQAAAVKTTAVPPAVPSPQEQAARMRQTIAAAMSRSKREIPHYYLSTTIDVQRAIDWLARENEHRSTADRLLYGVLLIKAVALALKEFPDFNSVWDGQGAVPCAGIHVGVAISLRQGGLIAPAIHNTDQQNLGELMSKLRDLVGRTRSGSLRSSELSDPTITVTNLGEQGVASVFGVIYPPQVAIIGFGKIVQRPWIVDGRIEPRSLLTATLSGDHRASDGHRGGLFLAAVDRLLQEPEKL